jgi:hypothetical protein
LTSSGDTSRVDFRTFRVIARVSESLAGYGFRS